MSGKVRLVISTAAALLAISELVLSLWKPVPDRGTRSVWDWKQIKQSEKDLRVPPYGLCPSELQLQCLLFILSRWLHVAFNFLRA